MCLRLFVPVPPSPLTAVRVATALDFSTFLRLLNEPRLANALLTRVYTEAHEGVSGGAVQQGDLAQLVPLLQRCRDLLSQWCGEVVGDEAGEGEEADSDSREGDTETGTSEGVKKPAALPIASVLSPRPGRKAPVSPTPSLSLTDPYIAPSPYDMLGLLQVKPVVVAEVSVAPEAGAEATAGGAMLPVRPAAAAGVTVSQVEVLLAVMPPAAETLDANALTESVSVVPSLHELFHSYTQGRATSGLRRDGANVVFGTEAMDMKAFVTKSASGGPTVPEQDFRRMLHDFGVTPKLVSFHVRPCAAREGVDLFSVHAVRVCGCE